MAKKSEHLGADVARLLYSPMMLAYGWVALDYVKAGAALYALTLFLSYKLGLFAEFNRWPMVSRAPLYSSPALLLVGLYFSTKPPTFWLLAPLFAHGLLCIVGGLTLGKSLENGAHDPPA